MAQLKAGTTIGGRDIVQELDSHKAENVTQADGVHGLKIETGTWTPVLNRTGAVYSQQYGHYIRIGNIVFCVGRIVLSSKGTSSLGTAIEGLPFPVADTDHRLQGIVCHNITLPTGFYNTVARLAPRSIYVYKSSGNWSDWLTYNEVQDNSEFYINILYRTA